jgi:hypothetical protein
MSRRHLIIPDTQVKPGDSVDHLRWCAKAIAKYKPDVIVHLGDHWDMHSLTSHDRPGSKQMEGSRYLSDVHSGNYAFNIIDAAVNKLRGTKEVEAHYLFGNHEERIERAIANEPKFDGAISLTHLDTGSFTRHPFLEVVVIDGVYYAHYFANTHSPYAIGGSIDNRLNKIGESFVQGHQQGFQYGCRVYPTGKTRHGLVAGSFYLHDEPYKGLQGNDHWRGIIVLNEVEDGDYNIMPLGMSYLKKTFGSKRK